MLYLRDECRDGSIIDFVHFEIMIHELNGMELDDR